VTANGRQRELTETMRPYPGFERTRDKKERHSPAACNKKQAAGFSR